MGPIEYFCSCRTCSIIKAKAVMEFSYHKPNYKDNIDVSPVVLLPMTLTAIGGRTDRLLFAMFCPICFVFVESLNAHLMSEWHLQKSLEVLTI